jgi:ankyrin repeat protein
MTGTNGLPECGFGDGLPEIVTMLLEGKADVEGTVPVTADNYFLQKTPLHLAVEHNNAKCVSILLEAKANVNALVLPKESPWHLPPLMVAADLGHYAIIASLLEAKADVHSPAAGLPPPLVLHNVAIKEDCQEQRECIARLLESKADVNSVNDRHETPLTWAIHIGKPDSMLTLLDAKADINHVNLRGESLLFETLMTPRSHHSQTILAMASILLQPREVPVNVLLKDKYGTTVLQAMKTQHTPLPEAILRHPQFQRLLADVSNTVVRKRKFSAIQSQA